MPFADLKQAALNTLQVLLTQSTETDQDGLRTCLDFIKDIAPNPTDDNDEQADETAAQHEQPDGYSDDEDEADVIDETDTDQVMHEEVVLESWQEEPAQKGLASLTGPYRTWENLGRTGNGKSYEFVWAVLQLMKQSEPVTVFCVCPRVMRLEWKRLFAMTGVPCTDIVTFRDVAGRFTGKTTKIHKWLTRTETRQGPVFHSSQQFKSLLQNNKVVFLIDEPQFVNQESNTFRAMSELIYETIDSDNGMIAKLTATAMCKAAQIRSVLITSGRLHPTAGSRVNPFYTTEKKSNKTISGSGVNMTLKSAQGFYDTCLEIDRAKSEALYRRYIVYNVARRSKVKPSGCMQPPERMIEFLLALRNEVWIPLVGTQSARPPEIRQELEVVTQNVFMCSSLAPKVKEHLIEFNRLCKEMQTKKALSNKRGLLGQIMKQHRELEECAVDQYVRRALHHLDADPLRKVVVCVNSPARVDSIASAFDDRYNVMKLHGSTGTSDEERKNMITRFQAQEIDPETNELKDRVFVATLSMISTGIGMDNKHTNGSVACIAAPTFRVIDALQLAGRFNRVGSKGKLFIEWVYHKVFYDGPTQLHLMRQFTHQSSHFKEVNGANGEDGMKFTEDYDLMQEPEPGKPLEPMSNKSSTQITVE